MFSANDKDHFEAMQQSQNCGNLLIILYYKGSKISQRLRWIDVISSNQIFIPRQSFS